MPLFRHCFEKIISIDKVYYPRYVGLRLVTPILLGSSMVWGSVWCYSSIAITRRAPIDLALIINRVTPGPTLDLPPLNQRPLLYSELELDSERLRTGTVETPQIGSSVYPDWAIYVEKEAIWLERGHLLDAAIRIFDQDEDDADDKILLTSLAFDPIACQVTIGEVDVEGDRQGSYCSVTIAELLGENGTAKFTLTADW